MQTLLILLAVILLLVLLYILNSRKRKKNQKLIALNRRNELINTYALTIDYAEEMAEDLLVLDENTQKLFLQNHKSLKTVVVSLSQVRKIEVKEIKETFDMGGKPGNKQTLVSRIVIELVFKLDQPALSIVCYDHIQHSIFEMQELKMKAQQACARIGNLLHAG